MQQCCSDLGRDVRVYIIGNKIIKAVLRTSTESFKSNYSLGGKVQEYTLNNEEKAMVERIVDKLPLDYAGIDFTFTGRRFLMKSKMQLGQECCIRCRILILWKCTLSIF